MKERQQSLYIKRRTLEKKKRKRKVVQRILFSSFNDSGDGYVSNSTLEGLVIKGGVGGQATGGGQVRVYIRFL